MEVREAEAIFNRNAATYDRVNSVLSLGLDARWRRWAARQAAFKTGAYVLDAFSGTGLVGIETAKMGAYVVLADISPGMLAIARQRSKRWGIPANINVIDLTREGLPYKKETFDAITMVFGIRYLKEPTEVISNLSSLLKPGGRLVALEFIKPSPGLLSTPAAFYFFNILPRIGSCLARRRELYDYLTSSTKALGSARSVRDIIISTGLAVTLEKRFGFGLVYGVVATV